MVLRDRIVRIAKVSLEVCEQLIIQAKLSLQRAIRYPPAAAQQGDHLIEHRIKVHYRPSTRASADSASGSHKVIAMERYNSMAVESSARACSRWPVNAYRVPRPRWQWACSGRMPSSS